MLWIWANGSTEIEDRGFNGSGGRGGFVPGSGLEGGLSMGPGALSIADIPEISGLKIGGRICSEPGCLSCLANTGLGALFDEEEY